MNMQQQQILLYLYWNTIPEMRNFRRNLDQPLQ